MNLKQRVICCIGSLVVLCLMLPAAAQADVIVGPTLNQNDAVWVYSGVGFTANVNSTLTSFVFNNQGQADTVALYDPLGNVLDSVAIAAGNPTDTVAVNWSLTAGDQYYLLQSTASNGLFADGPFVAPCDTEICMTDTGIFSMSPDSATFGINGTEYWADFNNITTGAPVTATPEPSSLLLLGTGLLAGVGAMRRKLRS